MAQCNFSVSRTYPPLVHDNGAVFRWPQNNHKGIHESRTCSLNPIENRFPFLASPQVQVAIVRAILIVKIRLFFMNCLYHLVSNAAKV